MNKKQKEILELIKQIEKDKEARNKLNKIIRLEYKRINQLLEQLKEME